MDSHFNSQPHKEADHGFITGLEEGDYFNSQPHKEADRSLRCDICFSGYFNSQPHKEADGKAFVDINRQIISTHSLTRRLTFYNISQDLAYIFQLTASQGG